MRLFAYALRTRLNRVDQPLGMKGGMLIASDQFRTSGVRIGLRPTRRVTIDRAKCQGTGYCVKLAPHLFQLGASPPVQFHEEVATDADDQLLRDAEDACPTRAISVDE